MKTFASRKLAILFSAILMLPTFAFAQTAETQTQIQSLLTQIHALQEQLATLIMQMHSASSSHDWMDTGSSTEPMRDHKPIRCIEFARDLHRGMQGDDVRDLQEMLSEHKDIFPEHALNGIFGPATERAVVRFQHAFGIASTTNGLFGSRSRGFVRENCESLPERDTEENIGSSSERMLHGDTSRMPRFERMNNHDMTGTSSSGRPPQPPRPPLPPEMQAEGHGGSDSHGGGGDH